MGHLLFILPICFALIVLFVPKNAVRIVGLLGGLTTLVITIGLICTYNSANGMHYFVKQDWIKGFGMTIDRKSVV